MNPMIQLVLFSTLLSATLSYAWWTRIRVWRLRQDLFAIRDDLWDAMRERGQLDDPAHRVMRELLNAQIRLAPMISIWTVLRILVEGPEPYPIPDETMPEPVILAVERAAARVAAYQLHETLSGFAIHVITKLAFGFIQVPSRLAESELTAWFRRAFSSGQIRDDGQLLKPGSRMLGNI